MFIAICIETKSGLGSFYLDKHLGLEEEIGKCVGGYPLKIPMLNMDEKELKGCDLSYVGEQQSYKAEL